MTINQKRKGNSFERDFADLLSSVFQRNFKRNLSGSGAFFGGGNFQRKTSGRDVSQVMHELGDVVPPTGYYVVTECKSYKDFPFHRLVAGEKTILNDWINESRYDATLEKDGKAFFPHWIGFKINRKGTYIVLPDQFFKEAVLSTDGISYTRIPHKSATGQLLDMYNVIHTRYLETLREPLRAVITDSKYYAHDVAELLK